jgi:hypothetical protein
MQTVDAKDTEVYIEGKEATGLLCSEDVVIVPPKHGKTHPEINTEDPIVKEFGKTTNREQRRAVVHKFGARVVARKLAGVFSRVKSAVAFNFTENKTQKNARKTLRRAS